MNYRFAHVLFLLLACLAGCQSAAPTKIAFGSCLRQDKPAPIWDSVAATRPDIFLFIGDNIYGDTDDMEVMRKKYGLLGAMPGYQSLKATCPIYATWDDHDYGKNDAGVEYPMKEESQKEFLTFFEEPANSPRWKRPGVYDARVLGPPGQRVQIILLDTRYFRSPLKEHPPQRLRGLGPYVADDRAEMTMLGEEQWKWLEQQLREPAEIRIIASSVQVVPEEHGWEYWANFPHERFRLFQLIGQTKAKGVVLISGDRHLAEISRLAKDDPANGAGYPIYDITSSSLNQPSGGNIGEKNKHRVGDHFRLVNFGMISIDWSANDPTMQFDIRGIDGRTERTQTVKLSELQ